MPLVIAACASTKAKGTRAAGVKYVTRNHSTILEFMLDGGYASGWNWAILSAEHGLVAPTTPISDYDTVLKPHTVDAFVAKHSKAICEEIDSDESANAILFIGSTLYYQALKAAAPHRKIRHIVGANRGCGDHFSALLEGFDMYDEAA